MTNVHSLKLKTLKLEQNGRVLTVRYSSPPLNFVTSAFTRDFDTLTKAIDHDDSIGAVVLTSGVAGRFMTHADPTELTDMPKMPIPAVSLEFLRPFVWLTRKVLQIPAVLRTIELSDTPAARMMSWGYRWRRTTLRMNRSSTVYIAAINGPTTGGGHEMVLACDLRLATDAPDVRLGQPEILAGLIPGGGGTQRLPKMIGSAKSLELMLEGKPLTSAEALQYGLVNAVVPAEELVSQAEATAARLAQRSPVAIQAIKRLTYFTSSSSLDVALGSELAGFLSSGVQPVAKDTISAFTADLARLGDSPLSTGDESWVLGTRVDFTPRPREFR